ncbi:MAG: beta strand repeat-containing protein, partial [Rhodomicrobium sp.]
MITRLRYPKGYQFFDSNGAPLALGNLYYYAAGTTTSQNTYSDSAGTVANANPIVLDGSGRLDVDVYLGSTANYKEVLTTASSTVSPWPDDNIPLASQPDWNATSGPNQILNKPALAAVATSGSYTDLSNTPPTNVPFTGDSGSGGSSGLVPAPAAGDAVANMFLSAGGAWAVPPGTSSTYTVTLNTSAAASSGTTLTFASVPTSIVAGMTAQDSTATAAIPSGATVVSVTATTVVLSGSITAPGVGSGDAIVFSGTQANVTNLSVTQSATAVSIGSSSGTGVTVPAATSTAAGVLDSTRAAKIDGLATVATSGSYSDLSNKPSIPAAASTMTGASASASGASGLVPAPSTGQQGLFLRGDATWAEPSGGSGSSPTNLSTSETATSVSISSSTGTGATIPAATSAAAGVLDATRAAKIDGLAAVATSGSYTDLSNPPAIPAAQVNSDWNAISGVSQILNKPVLAASATTDTTNASNITSGTLAAALVGDLSATYLKVSAAGANSGVATLDSGGKLSAAQIPASLVGAVVYRGAWDSSTNTPALASGAGTKGDYYVVSTAGTTAIDGISQWNAGDTIIFDGTQWDKIDGASPEVLSVAGLYGAIDGAALKSALSISAADVSGLATVASSGAYSSLLGLPTIPAAQVNSDWNATSGLAQILNQPTLAPSATTDTTNASNISSGTLPSAQLSGSYTGITGVGTLTAGSIPASLVTGLASVATSGAYSSLSGAPTLGTLAALSALPNPSSSSLGGVQAATAGANQYMTGINTSGVPQFAQPSASNVSGLARVATSGSYTDLSDTPSIPAAQINADWNASSGLAQILNKPTIPSYSAFSGDSGSGGATGLVPAPAAGTAAAGAYLNANGTWSVPPSASGSNGWTLANTSNYGFGASALSSITTGSYNLSVGYQAGAALTTGSNNFLAGYQAGKALTTGSNGVFIGYQAGLKQQYFAPSYIDTTGIQTNIGIGEGSLASTITSWGNIGIGRGTLAALTNNPSTSGSQNFLQNNFNVAIGDLAGNAITSGSENNFLGNNAGLSTTTGLQNTAIGTEPLKRNTTGCLNNAFGGSVFKGNLTGSYNTGVGNGAGGGDNDPATTTASNYCSYFGASANNFNLQYSVTAASSAGTNTLTMYSVNSIAVGMLVQDFTQFNNTASPVYTIPNNTIVTAINTSTKVVTLSQSIASPGVASTDTISFFGNPVSVATSAATSSGATLTFATVPYTIASPYNMGGSALGYGTTLTNTPGMLVYDLTTPSAIPVGTTVVSATSTTVTLSNSVAATVNSGDTIIFVKSQQTFMTLIGANCQGNRDNTIFLGRSSDSVVISAPVGGTNSLAGLTIGAGTYPRAAINVAQNIPSGQNPPINGDIWRDYSDNLWFRSNGNSVQLNTIFSNSNSDVLLGPNVGNTTLTGGLNTLIGTAIAPNISSGASNTLIGSYAAGGTSFTTQSNNTVVGAQAGNNLAAGSNTLIGSLAGSGGIVTSGANVCVGYNTGTGITSGTANITMGNSCGNALGSAYGCTIIGHNSNGGSGSLNTVLGY